MIFKLKQAFDGDTTVLTVTVVVELQTLAVDLPVPARWAWLLDRVLYLAARP